MNRARAIDQLASFYKHLDYIPFANIIDSTMRVG